MFELRNINIMPVPFWKKYLVQTELALHLCWAIGEHGAGGVTHKDVARELFESLELLLYENLSSRLVHRVVKN